MSMGESFKTSCQTFLKRAGAYQRIKSSFLYDAYWWIANPRLLDERQQQIAFFRKTLVGLPENALIFDIGANQGYKTDMFLRMGARVLAVDPDPANQEILRQRFLTYRLQKKAVTIIGKAVSDREGVETMWMDEPGSAKNTLNAKWVETLRNDATRFGSTLEFGEETKVETTTLEQLIATYGQPFYIKLDVEGYEASVLQGLRTAVPFISFEVNLPEFRAEGRQCLQLLFAVAATGNFNYSADAGEGLALPEWMSCENFLPIFERIDEPSVEVFWRTSAC
jgi:FkbM family methyltransferase